MARNSIINLSNLCDKADVKYPRAYKHINSVPEARNLREEEKESLIKALDSEVELFKQRIDE